MATAEFTAITNAALYGPTGRLLDNESIPEGARVIADVWVRDVSIVPALEGTRRVYSINGIEQVLARFVDADDLIPYDETQTEPPAGQTLTIPPGQMQITIVINGETKKFQNAEAAVLVESNG